MQQVLKAVNDFFGIFVGFSNFLWSFPVSYTHLTLPTILLV